MSDDNTKQGSSFHLIDGIIAVIVAIVIVMVGLWVLDTLAGLFWELLKLAIGIVVLGAVVTLLVRRRRT